MSQERKSFSILSDLQRTEPSHERKTARHVSYDTIVNEASNTFCNMKDPKLRRNALCTDWPNYMLRNKHAVMVNSKG